MPKNSTLSGIGVQATGGVALFVLMLWWWRSGNAPVQASPSTGELAKVLYGIDRVYPQVRSVVYNESEAANQDYRVKATLQGKDIVFQDRAGKEQGRITHADFEELPEDSLKLIRSIEKSMSRSFDEWTKVYPQRNIGSPERRQQAKARLEELAGEICGDLNRILQHLGDIGRELDDHYSAMRSICAQLGGNKPLGQI